MKKYYLLTTDTSNYEYYDFNKFNELSDIGLKEISEKLTV